MDFTVIALIQLIISNAILHFLKDLDHAHQEHTVLLQEGHQHLVHADLHLLLQVAQQEQPQLLLLHLLDQPQHLLLHLLDQLHLLHLTERKDSLGLKKLHYATEGVDLVGCFYGSVPPECDPYLGDTLCTESRPVLCIKVDGTNRPHYPRWSTLSPFYYGWSEGSIDLSPSVLGTSLTSLAAANQVCSDSFGAGWRMAEFHDGLYAGTNPEEPFGSDWAITPKSHGGWHINAFGNVRSDTKYWVSINDQQANCWN